MDKKVDFNKIVYAIIAVLLAVIVITAICLALSNKKEADEYEEDMAAMEEEYEGIKAEKATEVETDAQGDALKSQIDEGNLPTDDELSSVGLDNVMQTSKINEQFNLYNYEVLEDSIKYNYLSNAVTNGERLSVTAKAMSEEEYNEMLPTAKLQENEINGVSVVFNDRTLFYTDNEDNVPDYVKEAEKNGNTVIRYGNSLAELLPMQQMMWYEDGIGYTLESISRYYTYDDMAKLTEDFFNAVK